MFAGDLMRGGGFRGGWSGQMTFQASVFQTMVNRTSTIDTMALTHAGFRNQRGVVSPRLIAQARNLIPQRVDAGT
jgi:hypothetical protein